MAESTMQKVERFRDGIETAKTDKTRLVTQLEAVDAQLADEFESITEAQARKVLDKDVAAEKRLGQAIAEGRDKLEERYDW